MHNSEETTYPLPLELYNVSREFGSGARQVTALKEANLQLHPGKLIASDLDETLLDSEHCLPKNVREAFLVGAGVGS